MGAVHKTRFVAWTTGLILAISFLASANAAEVNRGAIALLVAKNSNGEVIGTGSGFVVQAEGTLMTN